MYGHGEDGDGGDQDHANSYSHKQIERRNQSANNPAKLFAPSFIEDDVNDDNFDVGNQNIFQENKRNKYLQGMSSRQQVKFLMQKTKEEANWVLGNDSDVKGGSGKFIGIASYCFHASMEMQWKQLTRYYN